MTTYSVIVLPPPPHIQNSALPLSIRCREATALSLSYTRFVLGGCRLSVFQSGFRRKIGKRGGSKVSGWTSKANAGQLFVERMYLIQYLKRKRDALYVLDWMGKVNGCCWNTRPILVVQSGWWIVTWIILFRMTSPLVFSIGIVHDRDKVLHTLLLFD